MLALHSPNRSLARSVRVVPPHRPAAPRLVWSARIHTYVGVRLPVSAKARELSDKAVPSSLFHGFDQRLGGLHVGDARACG